MPDSPYGYTDHGGTPHCNNCGFPMGACSCESGNKTRESGNKICFPASAEVLTPNGTRLIAELVAGNDVYAFGQDGRIGVQSIIRRKDYPKTNILSIHADNGAPVRVTASHSILTEKGWKRVGNLKPGDVFFEYYDGTLAPRVVRHFTREATPETVHNLIVSNCYTFVVRGCIAHSFTYFRSPRMFLSRVVQASAKLVSAQSQPTQATT